MFQIYLLTVITTLLAGLALASGFLSERFPRFSDFTEFTANTTYRLILGTLTLLIGIINAFSTYPGDIPVLGELFPSLAGLAAGILLIVQFITSKSPSGSESKAADLADRVERFSGPYTAIVGLAVIIVGILHAALPELPLL